MSELNPTGSAAANVSSPPLAATSARVESVDALRGLVILLMIFVNDVAGAPHVSAWLKHVSAEADAMTLPDIVFPAFLFIAGVSIPLAFERARARGATRGQLVRKTLGRAAALLIMGVVMVNHEEIELGAEASWWQRQWGLAAYVAMFLAFAVVPERAGRARALLRGARVAGVVALVALAFVFRTGDGQAMLLGPLLHTAEPVWLRHSWWGILGLIGWAYLIAALVYLAVGRRREWLVGATACLMLLYFGTASEFAERLADRPWLDGVRSVTTSAGLVLGWINAHVSLGSSLGSLAAVTMAGCCLGSILVDRSDVRTPAERLRWALGFAAGLFLVGVLTDGTYGINKIRATPAWCFYCAALTTAVWAVLYGLMDLRGVRSWSRVVAPAGANPLLAYLLHPFVFLLAGAGGDTVSSFVFFYKSAQLPAVVAVMGSLVMAILVVQATGWIARAGFRLKV